MRRFGYARVSTEDQHHNLQIDALKKARCSRIFREKVSGKAERQPQLERAISGLERGDRLVLWKADRLGRDFYRCIKLAEMLDKRGVVIECVSQGIETTNSAGKLVFRIACAVSAFDRDQISERTTAALQAIKRRGQKLGRRRKIKPKKLEQAVALRRDTDLPMSTIAKKLRVNRATLKRALDQVA